MQKIKAFAKKYKSEIIVGIIVFILIVSKDIIRKLFS
jgi:hypothetical protein